MPLVEIRKLRSANFLGVWRINEAEEYFHSELLLDQDELNFLGSINHESRRKQWLASRLLIRKIINPKGQILMEWDSFGKPVIVNYDFEVSISHCKDMVAVIVGDKKSGIDIEKKTDRILRIAHKFVRQDELDFIEKAKEADYYLTIWAAKETMFKYMGGGGIDFKEHMRVWPFAMQNSGEFSMSFLKGEEMAIKLSFEWIEDHILTYSI